MQEVSFYIKNEPFLVQIYWNIAWLFLLARCIPEQRKCITSFLVLNVDGKLRLDSILHDIASSV